MVPPKISIIMQAYLGDYPGSRTNSVDKFIRAVSSFKNQTYENIELIIVSDGCEIVHKTYMELLQSDSKIKYAFVDKKGIPNMYELVDGKKYYRGVPRQVGITLANGDLITYMDSDDFLLSNHCELIVREFIKTPNLDFYANAAWYDNSVVEWPESNSMYATNQYEFYNIKDLDVEYRPSRIRGLDSTWVISSMKPGMLNMAPWLFIHKNVDDIKWRDTVETSEDVDFNTRFRKKYKVGIQINIPSYIRCHYSGLWDY
jgi:glycosyltransferase involved in cell wall biosynthesis